MALDKLTIIDGGGLSTTSDYRVGVITATKFVGPIEGAITSTDATFTGNVTIGGTLTYEDVTNIDSVGLVTARDGIFVPDDKSIRIGNTFANPDLKIHSSSTYEQAVIDYTRSGTGRALRIRSTNTQIENWNGLAPIAKFVGGVGVGHVELNYAGDKKFETTTKGIQVGTGVTFETNGQGTFSGIVTSRGYEVGTSDGAFTYNYFKAGRIRIFDNGSHCHFRFGDHPSYAPNQRYSSSVVERTNSYYLQNTAATRYGIGWVNGSNHASGQGSVNLYYSGGYAPDYGIKLSTHSGGVLVSGVTTTTNLAVTGVSTFTGSVGAQGQIQSFYNHASQPRLYLSGISGSGGYNYLLRGDNDAGSRAVHFVNGSTRSADNGANTYTIRNDGGKLHLGKPQYATVLQGSTSYLQHGTSTKLYTTGTGINISDNLNLGNETSAGIASPVELNLGGTYRNAAGGNSKLKLWSDGTDQMGFGVSASQLDLILTSDNFDFVVYSGASGTTERFRLDGATGDLAVTGDIHIDSTAGGGSNLAANDTAWNRIEFDNDYNSTPNGPNKILLHDDSSWKAGFGISTNSLDIYSGANIRLYGKATTHNAASRETLAEFLMDNAVKLYYDGTTKFETQSSGAMVLGALRLQGTESSYITGQAQPLIYRTGSTSGSYPFNNFGHLVIQTRIDGSNRDIIFATGTSSANQIVINSLGDMKIPDGKELQFGGPLDSGDGDLRIHHNATHSFIQNATGDLNIQGDVVRIKKYDGGKTMAAFIQGGQAEFYFDTTRRLTTSMTGINVTGEVEASQDYPNFRPILDLNFAATKKLDPRISYTRSGPASYTNEFSEVVLVGDNVPRFDHDLTTGESKGLLNEEEVTNTCTYSEIGQTTLNSSGIGGNNGYARISTDFITPEGKFGRCLDFKMRSTTQGGYYRRGGYINITAGEKYTVSMFIRNGDPDNQDLEASTSGTYLGIHLYKTGSGQNAALGFGHADMKKERYAHGWTRYSATFTAQSTANGVHGFFNISSSIGAYLDWSLQLWGFQIEAGGYSTSYIPTEASSVTRGADTTVIDGEEFNEFFDHRGNEANNYQGTLLAFIEQPVESFPSTGRYNKIQLERSNDNKVSLATLVQSAGNPDVQGMISYGTATQIDKTSSGSTFPTIVKHGIAYAKNSGAYTFNGNTVQTDNSMNIANSNTNTHYTQLSIGAVPRKSHIKRIMYYNNRISDTQLRNLTS